MFEELWLLSDRYLKRGRVLGCVSGRVNKGKAAKQDPYGEVMA